MEIYEEKINIYKIPHKLKQKKVYFCNHIDEYGIKCENQRYNKGLCFSHSKPENKRKYTCEIDGCNKQRQSSYKRCYKHRNFTDEPIKIVWGLHTVYF